MKAYLYNLCLVTIALLFSALITLAATVTQNFTISISPSGPTPPPQAVTAGFTINALNQDWTTGPFSHDCAGGDTAGSLWYVVRFGILQADCNALTWPDTDQSSQVLTIKWTPSYGGRTGITSSSANDVVSTTFPVKGYYECTIRMTAHLGSTEIDFGNGAWLPGPWFNCWQWGSKTQPSNPVGCNVSPTICYERDYFEVHAVQPNGFPPQFQYAGDFFTWGAAGAITSLNETTGNTNFQFTAWCSRSPCADGPVYNPSQYHTYGFLVTSATGDSHCGSIACLKTDFYIDNAGPFYTVWYNDSSSGTTDHAAQQQRSFAIADAVIGCWNGGEGNRNCNNLAVTESNSGGNLLLTLPRADCDGITCISGFNGSIAYLQGVGGNVPDGNYTITFGAGGNPVTATLAFYPAGGTVPFTSGYTGGTFNPITSADMHLKSFRAWVGCAAWQTTQC